MRRALFFALPAAVALVVAALAGATPLRANGSPETYVVLYDANASLESARDAVRAAGGQVLRENLRVGVATATSSNPDFVTDVAATQAVEGAARNAPIGHARSGAAAEAVPRGSGHAPRTPRVAPSAATRGATSPRRTVVSRSPICNGTCNRSTRPPTARTARAGEQQVLVGIIDTGVDGSHPDIAPNFNRRSAGTSRPTSRRRRPLRGGARRFLQRPGRRRRERARHARRQHRRLADQRARHRGRRAEGEHREPARRPGLGLLLPAGDVDALTYAGDSGDRRREHELLHRPVALQLREQPGRQPGGAARAADDRRGDDRALDYAHAPRRDAGRRRGQRRHRPRQPDVRRVEPGLPAREASTTAAVDNSCLSMPTEGDT